MTTSRNLSTSSKKPCEKGKMRTKVIQYRCVTNKTFHDKVNKKLTNMRPRSSRKSGSSPKLRKTSTQPRRTMNPSLANAIKSISKLRKTSTPPRRTMNPSLANAIKSMSKLRKTSPRRMMNPSLANAIRGMSKLRKNSPVKFAPKPSLLNDIRGMSKNKLRKVSSPVKKLPVINNKYNELLNKLAVRRKTLKESSGSGDWS